MRRSRKPFRLHNLDEDLRIIYKRYYMIRMVFCFFALFLCLFQYFALGGLSVLTMLLDLILVLVPPILYRSVALKIYNKRHCSGGDADE